MAIGRRLLLELLVGLVLLGCSGSSAYPWLPQPLSSAVDRFHAENGPVPLPHRGQPDLLPPQCNVDVVIVGGGLAGLALLMGIATNCPERSVVLIEKRSEYVRAGAILGLAANGARALDELAGGPDLVRQLQQCGRDMGPIEDISVHLLPWWVVRDALLERSRGLAEKSGGKVVLCNGLDLETIDETEDGRAELRFANAPERRITARLVVGADGVRSMVRTVLGLSPAEDSGKRSWRGVLQIDEVEDEHDRAAIETMFEKGPMQFLKNDGQSHVAVFNQNEIMPGLLVWTIGTSLHQDEEVAAFLAGVDDEDSKVFDAILRRTPHIAYTKISTMNMDHLSEDTDVVQGWGGSKCTTLIGDAAHACRPTDGQGANLAFEDACVLVRRLKGTNILDDDFVLGFENERRPRVKRIHRDQAERALKQGKDWTRWTPEFTKWVYDGV